MSDAIDDIAADKTLAELDKQYSNATYAAVPPLDISSAILSYEALLGADLLERKKILPWLPEGGLVMVSAERGLGKTHFALSLAVAISNQENFMRWTVNQAAGVMYIDGEMALVEIRERLKLFAPAIPKEPLTILSHEWFFNKLERDLTITDHTVQEAILNELSNQPEVKVIILDNLSSLTRIRENESDDWRNCMLPFLIACRRRSVAVVLIHHCGKNGDQRGSGAREDHLDTSIKLTKLAEHTNTDGCCFQVNFIKSRNCYGEEIETFVAKLIQADEGSAWEIEAISESTKDKLFKLIVEHGDQGIQAVEAARKLGISKSMVSRLKTQLEGEGRLQLTKGKAPMRLVKSNQLAS